MISYDIILYENNKAIQYGTNKLSVDIKLIKLFKLQMAIKLFKIVNLTCIEIVSNGVIL